MSTSEEIDMLGRDLFSMGFDIPREAISRLIIAGWTYRPEDWDYLTPEGRLKLLRAQNERNQVQITQIDPAYIPRAIPPRYSV